MVADPRKRQKQLARKKAKHSANVAAKRVRKNSLEARGIRTAPIGDCLVSDDIQVRGMGSVVMTRSLPDGRVAFASFLLDILCLGVKDAMSLVTTPSHYHEIRGKLTAQFSYERIDPPSARKLIESAVQFADLYNLEPHPDFFPAAVILGDIDPDQAQREYTFGRNGKPLYVAGPYETAEDMKHIRQAIAAGPKQREEDPKE